MNGAPLSRVEWATGRLEQAILSGELVPGERLLSSELAERWSVSATPLREALQRLAANGFVEHTPQRGARVSEVSERDVREVYELRLLLEPMALERSLGQTDDSWRKEVDEAYGRLRAELEGGIGNMISFERVNRDFHGTLLSRCDSAWLLRIVGVLADHSLRYRALSWLPRGGAEEVLREHEKLYKACVSGDVEDAVRLASDHLRLTLESVGRPGRGPRGKGRRNGGVMKGKAVPLLLAVVVALLVVATTGCGLASEEEADSGSSEEPIVIGGSLPLSGTYGETGAYVLDGYEAWADEVNSNGGLLGRTVELSIQDDRSDPSQAVSLLQRAINQEDVDLLSGGYPGDSAAAQMSIAEQSQMVYVSMGGHLQSFEQGFEYSFGAPPLMGQWWYDGFFDWLDTQPREQWPETAALMSVNNPVGDAVREGSVRELEERGIEVVMDESYDLPLASAESLVTRAKQADADLFFANGFFEDGVQTVEAIETVEYRPRAVLQGVGTLVPSWEEELGEGGNFVFSGTAMHPDLPFEGVDRVNQLAEENYGTPKAPPYFMFGYAWMQTLQAAVEGAGSLDQDAIRYWLRNNEISTIGGTFGLDERGLPEQYQYLIQVQDGSPTLVWPEDVQTADPVYPLPE